MSVKVSGTIRIEIDNKVIEISRMAAKQLLDALKTEFEQSPLNYPQGVRISQSPTWLGPQTPTFPYTVSCESK